jgi:flavin reductase (DIM6/NTAB) family NADH-FMN oxidoreductase RutF
MPGTTPQSPTDGTFQRVGIVDNFYQASSFIPMSFALVTTVHDNGETGIGPHALLFPFSISKPHSMMLISRNNSGTATNIRRHGKCALNYVLFDRSRLQGIADMGYPGMSLEDKSRANPYTMIDSPSPDKAADPQFPQIIKEAYQVFECTWNDSFALHDKTDGHGNLYDGHFNLIIDNLLVKERYVPGIEKGEIFPNMPIFCGYRANRGFWFAEHGAPFNVPLPTVAGMEYQTVFYMGNRIDENVSFTEEACKKLTGIPQPFMQDALKEIVAMALADGIAEIDEHYLEKINAERG